MAGPSGGPSRTVAPGVSGSSPLGRPTNPARFGDSAPLHAPWGHLGAKPGGWPHDPRREFGNRRHPDRPWSFGVTPTTSAAPSGADHVAAESPNPALEPGTCH